MATSLLTEGERRANSILPRLLYVGDVPVESSYHGSALLYRIFHDYPTDRLRVVEFLNRSLPERRLRGVSYYACSSRLKRLLTTRIHKHAAIWLTLTAGRRWREVARLLRGFAPDAIVTVAHGFSWLTAAELAERTRLPLHVIVHDDWPRLFPGGQRARSWIDRRFERCYRAAVSRLCVSPYMVDEYERRYGVRGTVLYPSRAANAKAFYTPPERLREAKAGVTAVFAGTINTPGHVKTLRTLADCLGVLTGRLLVYGPLTTEDAVVSGLEHKNIELRGLVSSSELIERCRQEADVLFVPMSFDPKDRPNMELLFPSKLTDYTAMGLPLLIYGPEYSSAVRWTKENPGVAEVVTEECSEELLKALRRLQQPDARLTLANAAIARGHEFFDHRRAVGIIDDALVRNHTR